MPQRTPTGRAHARKDTKDSRDAATTSRRAGPRAATRAETTPTRPVRPGAGRNARAARPSAGSRRRPPRTRTSAAWKKSNRCPANPRAPDEGLLHVDDALHPLLVVGVAPGRPRAGVGERVREVPPGRDGTAETVRRLV